METRCKMPLSDRKETCNKCAAVGPWKNCELKDHMMLCEDADFYDNCYHRERPLCKLHANDCYCLRRLTEKPFRRYRFNLLRSQKLLLQKPLNGSLKDN